MQATSQNAASPIERVSRVNLFADSGSYWAACRKDDADDGMYGPLMMPHAVPAAMLNNQIAEAVWTTWYGSQKDARKAASLSGRRLTELEQNCSRKLEDLSPYTRLTRRLDHDLMRLAADPANTGASTSAFKLHTQTCMPLLRLDTVLARQIGAENYQQLCRLTMAAPAVDLAQIVEGEFPFMADLHRRGALIRSTCRHLLAIACLLEALRPEFILQEHEALANRLLITILIRSLPPRIGILAAVTNPEIGNCFEWPCRFGGVSHADLRGDPDIWRHVPQEVLEETVSALQNYSMMTYSDHLTDGLVRRLDALVMAAVNGQVVSLELNAVHQDFLAMSALAVHDELKMLIAEGGIFFAAQPYEVPDDMVRPGFSLAFGGNEIHVATSLFSIILSTHFAGSIRPLLSRLAKYKADLDKTGKKIESLSSSGSPKEVAKIEAVGKKGMAELEAGRSWFIEEAIRLKALLTAWADFYRQVDSLRLQPLS